MTMRVIGAGVGRTGTYSLKLAINRLGLGPCHHMEEVLHNRPVQLPLWVAALSGQPDWAAIYSGYESAVDWPTAAFFRELSTAYPKAKFVLTHRSPESWAASFSETIYKLLAGRDQAPEEMRPWLDMAVSVIDKSGFREGLDVTGLMGGFTAHCEAVKETIPAEYNSAGSIEVTVTEGANDVKLELKSGGEIDQGDGLEEMYGDEDLDGFGTGDDRP